MSVSSRHLLEQGPVLRMLAMAGVSSLVRRAGPGGPRPSSPGPWVEAELPPRSEALVRDYVRAVGGDPSAYSGRIPAHFFPQWGLPLAARALSGAPYPLARVMNAGCRIEQRGPLPARERLVVRARLEALDDDGRRALITQRIVTGTRSSPDAVVADVRAFVPLAGQSKSGAEGTPRARPVVPSETHHVAALDLGPRAGLDFAKLTGDLNPIHWLGPYARAAGFRGCILHGFATLARAVEALNRALWADDPTRWSAVDVRFTRPLLLPACVGVYVSDAGGLWVGDHPGGDAYLEGHFQRKDAP